MLCSQRMGSTSGDSPLDIYSIACQLGVGYDTLVRHLKWSENLLDHARMLDLQRIPPKEIRRNVLGAATAGHMVSRTPTGEESLSTWKLEILRLSRTTFVSTEPLPASCEHARMAKWLGRGSRKLLVSLIGHT